MPVDLGASWIHGHQGNPLTDLAERFGVRTAVSNFDSIAAYDDTGKIVSLGDVTRAIKVYEELQKGLDALENQFAMQDEPPTSFEAAIASWQQAAEVNQADRRTQRLLARNEIEGDYAADLDELRFPPLDDSEEFKGQQRIFPGGYAGIIDGLSAGLDIRLQTAVKAIDYGRTPVLVETSAGPFTATHVIVTVPLGVLKNGAIRFTPELPGEKQLRHRPARHGLVGQGGPAIRSAFLAWSEHPGLHHRAQGSMAQRVQPATALRLSGAGGIQKWSGRARRRTAHRRRAGRRPDRPVAAPSERKPWSRSPGTLPAGRPIRSPLVPTPTSASAPRPTITTPLAAPLADRLFLAAKPPTGHPATVHGATCPACARPGGFWPCSMRCRHTRF